MKPFRFVIAATLSIYGRTALAQQTFPRNDVKDARTGAFAFTNATIVVDDQTFLQNATLVIKSGKIEQVGTQVIVPAGYTTVDLKGKYIYPSLIDMYTSYGLPDVDRARGGNPYGGAEQIDSKTKGAYNANQAIRSHYNAADEFSINSKTADELRKIGFGSVLTFKPDGIARGTSAFVTLGEETENKSLIKAKATSHYSLNLVTSTQNYPRSMIGFVALVRQTYLDAEWFVSQNRPPFAYNSLHPLIPS